MIGAQAGEVQKAGMDAGKRGREGAGPSGPQSKRGAPGAGGWEMDDDLAEEAFGARASEGLQDDDMDAEDVDERLLEEELELHLGEAGRNWERPAPPCMTPATDSIGGLLVPAAW